MKARALIYFAFILFIPTFYATFSLLLIFRASNWDLLSYLVMMRQCAHTNYEFFGFQQKLSAHRQLFMLAS